jgi:cell division protein FtsW
VVVYRGFRIIVRTRDEFGSLLATGIVCWIAYQALINVGGVTRAIPMTGIPMPFLSYGGSALAALLAATGILLSISRHADAVPRVERPVQDQVPRLRPTRGAR